MAERSAKRSKGGDGGPAGSGGAGPAGSGGGATRLTSSKGKVIAVYNYKGGCGKTTTSINVASVMAHTLKKKVLLVDCDPQCNLTSFLYPEPVKSSEVVDEEEGEDDEDASSMETEDDEDDEDQGISRILPKVKSIPLHASVQGALDVNLLEEGIRLARPHIYDFLEGMMVNGDPSFLTEKDADGKVNLDKIQKHNLKYRSGSGGELWLIPGHPSIIKCEQHYNDYKKLVQGPFCRYGLRYLIDRAVERHKIDIVLVDFGPSASPLNINWIASCDMILPPCFADYFNCASLHGLLTSVLPEVIKYHKERLKNQMEEMDKNKCLKDFKTKLGDECIEKDLKESLKFGRYPPKLLCTVVTNFKVKSGKPDGGSQVKGGGGARGSGRGARGGQDGGGGVPVPKIRKVVIATCSWVKTLEKIFSSEEVSDDVRGMFLPSGMNSGLEGCETVFRSGGNETKGSMVVCLTPNFNQLQQISQEIGIPVPMFSQGTIGFMKQDEKIKRTLQNIDPKTHGPFAEAVCLSFQSLAKYILKASEKFF
jgi:cellulose biosynthesis protein BcsQ